LIAAELAQRYDGETFLRGFGIGPVLDALHRLEVEFYPVPLVLVVDEQIGVRTEAVAAALACGKPASLLLHLLGLLGDFLGRLGSLLCFFRFLCHVFLVGLVGLTNVRTLRTSAHAIKLTRN
jgi:hypothetical protein